jgi:hypothetical protein
LFGDDVTVVDAVFVHPSRLAGFEFAAYRSCAVLLIFFVAKI